MDDQWSWDQNPVNLTCIATGIPNATITWWFRDREIGREIVDRNYKVPYNSSLFMFVTFSVSSVTDHDLFSRWSGAVPVLTWSWLRWANNTTVCTPARERTITARLSTKLNFTRPENQALFNRYACVYISILYFGPYVRLTAHLSDSHLLGLHQA